MCGMATDVRSFRVRWPLAAALLAALSCLVALIVFAAQLDGYRHDAHPIAWLGGRGLPGAGAFNLLAFILPGGLLAAVGWRQREALPAAAGMAARIGCWLALLSALALAAQGLSPLDLEELDDGASRGHAVAWMLWWMAFVPGLLLQWFGLRRLPDQRRWACGCLVVGIAFPLLSLWLPGLLAQGHAQRLGLALWFGWWLLAAFRLSRLPAFAMDTPRAERVLSRDEA